MGCVCVSAWGVCLHGAVCVCVCMGLYASVDTVNCMKWVSD